MTTPELRFAFEIDVEVATPLDLGQTQVGHRRIIPIAGGLVSGPKLQGRILAFGADWQIFGRTARRIWMRAIRFRPTMAPSSML